MGGIWAERPTPSIRVRLGLPGGRPARIQSLEAPGERAERALHDVEPCRAEIDPQAQLAPQRADCLRLEQRLLAQSLKQAAHALHLLGQPIELGLDPVECLRPSLVAVAGHQRSLPGRPSIPSFAGER
jgi:hypothetical protein